ncbi:MAG: hypothetical protein U1F25_06955 [Rubrivivax sp.]
MQQRQQVGAVRHVARRAVEPLALVAHRLHEEHAAVLPAAEFPRRLQPHRELRQPLRQAEARQRPHDVRRHHEAGAHLAQHRCLLVHRGVEPGLAQEQGRGQAADAAADDGNSHVAQDIGSWLATGEGLTGDEDDEPCRCR